MYQAGPEKKGVDLTMIGGFGLVVILLGATMIESAPVASVIVCGIGVVMMMFQNILEGEKK